MTLKEELMQELEQLPEAELANVPEFVQVRVVEATPTIKAHTAQPNAKPVWQTYLKSKREREEVYHRFANASFPSLGRRAVTSYWPY
jgi:hypothetical protein